MDKAAEACTWPLGLRMCDAITRLLHMPSRRVQTLFIRGGIQNIPDWCRHLYSSCGSAMHRSQQAKLWIPDSTATFCGDCVKTCEDVAPNFRKNRPGCFTITTPPLTLPPSPSSFWRNTKWLSSPTHRTPYGGTGVYMREVTTSRVMAAVGLMVSFMIFTASVRNILDTPSYTTLTH
jgi:hypothetical protein